MADTKPFQLVQGDIDIIGAVFKYRLVTVSHLQTLTGRARSNLQNRLIRLTQQGYLYRKRFQFQPFVYAISIASVPVLVEQGAGAKEDIDDQVLQEVSEEQKKGAKRSHRRLRELSHYFLKHELMLTNIHLNLHLALKDSPLVLNHWRQGKVLHDSVRVQGHEKPLPVRPDAFFIIERRAQTITPHPFFIEADRSSTTTGTFQKKIVAYWNYYRQGLHTKKYGSGVRVFRVVTITVTEKRAENLCRDARAVLPEDRGRFFYFAHLDHFSKTPVDVHANIFMSPLDFDKGKRYSLIPPLAPNAPTQ